MKKRNIKIAITGHRIFPDMIKEKENFFSVLKEWFDKNIDRNQALLHNSVTLLHGCALGVDHWFGEFCINNDYVLELHLPFPADTQKAKARMDELQKHEFERQLSKARKIIIVNDKYFKYGYQKRNMSLVDHSDILLGYYTRGRSGSANCARYYKRLRKVDAFNLKTGMPCHYENRR